MARLQKDIPVKDVERLAGLGLTEEQIAHCVGVSLSTLKRQKANDELLQASIKRGRSKAVSDVSNALFQAAISGNVTAMIFYLKNRYHDAWSDRQEPPKQDEVLPEDYQAPLKVDENAPKQPVL